MIIQCCDKTNQNGIFKNSKVSITYFILKNDRGVRFDIEGKKDHSYFTELSSFEEIRLIKRELQNPLWNTGLTNERLEFVIDLPNFNYP